MKTIITKTGKKITFASPKSSDLTAIYQWVKTIEKEDTFILLNYREPVFFKEEKEFLTGLLKKIKTNKSIFISVFDQHKYLGSCSIDKLGKRQGHVGSFGIALLKSYRAEGIGYQLAQYAIQQAKEKLKLKQIILGCFANNLVGLKLYQKLGFTQYGIHPKAIFYQGKYLDEILFYKNLK
ncbi:MAG: GNAT family protein [Candidatus Beckwithbacteria bacterium]